MDEVAQQHKAHHRQDCVTDSSVQWDVEIYDQESGTRASSNLELYLVGLFTGLATRHVGVRGDIICLRWRSWQQETRTSDFLSKIQWGVGYGVTAGKKSNLMYGTGESQVNSYIILLFKRAS